MKTLGRAIVIVLASLLALNVSSYARSGQEKDWQDKMKAERVAFLTSSMELTSAEAEKFWPIYNSMESERRASFGKMMRAYKALEEALKANKSDSEITELLNAYLQANEDSRAIDAKYIPMFKKVLSEKKIAKMYIAEEQFRRQQIGRWNGGDRGGDKGGDKGERGGK